MNQITRHIFLKLQRLHTHKARTHKRKTRIWTSQHYDSKIKTDFSLQSTPALIKTLKWQMTRLHTVSRVDAKNSSACILGDNKTATMILINCPCKVAINAQSTIYQLLLMQHKIIWTCYISSSEKNSCNSCNIKSCGPVGVHLIFRNKFLNKCPR